MTISVLGLPDPPYVPPPLNPGWERAQVVWEAWDGSTWTLSDPDGGVFVVRGGMRGLGMPTGIKHYRDQSPATHGAQWRGLVYESREVFWPLYLYADGGTREWVERDAAFWASLHPEHEGRLSIIVPGVSTRSLMLRLESDGGWAPEMDPTFFGWAQYGITLMADQPLWEGSPVRLTWAAGTPPLFHGGETPGDPIIRIASGRTASTATVTNPGQAEAWATWTFYGPLGATGAMVTVDGRDIDVPFEVVAGDKVVIDTSPREQTAYLVHPDGSSEDVFGLLGAFEPWPIQAGDAADLTLLLRDGTGSIGLEMVPLHLRAW